MYGKYNPFADTLRIECVISGDDFSDEFDYQPTAAESQLIKDMITERIREVHGQTPKEFCNSFITQAKRCMYIKTEERSQPSKSLLSTTHPSPLRGMRIYSGRQHQHIRADEPKRKRIQDMIDYCKVRGISKILVDSLHDIGEAPADVDKVVGYLCGRGFRWRQ